MEQVNAGIVKLMNLTGNSHVNGNLADFGAKREPIFDVLLEQKNRQAHPEVVSDRRKNEDPEKIPTKEVEAEKKTAAVKEGEEETCDVAREVAAAQMVWLVAPNAADLRIPGAQKDVMTIEQPLIIGINDEPSAVLTEEVLAQFAGNIPVIGEMPEGEVAIVAEEELMPEQIIEAIPEEGQTELETNVGEQQTEDVSVEIRVTEGDSEEISAEAAVAETPLFEEVEAAPIKVAEAPERTEKAPEVEKQVADKLVSAFESGETKVEIQLDPVELGKLTIELTRNTDGTLNILLNAENIETRGLLERHVSGLQEALAERGQNSVQITVDQSEESQRQDNGNQRNDFQDGSNGRQSEQRRRDDHRSGEDFLQQLRLGLIPIEEEEED